MKSSEHLGRIEIIIHTFLKFFGKMIRDAPPLFVTLIIRLSIEFLQSPNESIDGIHSRFGFGNRLVRKIDIAPVMRGEEVIAKTFPGYDF